MEAQNDGAGAQRSEAADDPLGQTLACAFETREESESPEEIRCEEMGLSRKQAPKIKGRLKAVVKLQKLLCLDQIRVSDLWLEKYQLKASSVFND